MGKGRIYTIMKKQELYWGMHFCNSRMFKTVSKVEMYIHENEAVQKEIPESNEECIYYYMTEHGQIFKFNKTKFESYELDLQNMVWFDNRDFISVYLDNYMKYTEIKDFKDYYVHREK